jgi:hypothetical protein
MESKVGKVQGVRTKRKKTEVESVQSDDGTVSHSNSATIRNEDDDDNEERDRNRGELAVSSLPSPKRRLPDPEDQGPLQPWSPGSWSWNNDFFPLDGSMTSIYTGETGLSSTSETTSDQLSSSITPSSIRTSLASVDCNNIGNSTNTSSIQSFATPISISSISQQPSVAVSAIPQPPDIMSPQRQQALAARNSKCVLALANIVVTLENYIINNLKVLDLIITSVRSVAEEMRKVLQHQRELRSERCMFLSTTIMHQVIELLEAGANDVFERERAEQGHTGASDDFLDFTPKIGFGALSTFNVEEQRAMKINVLRRECQNMEEVLGQLIALAKLGPIASLPLTPAEMDDKAKCFSGLQIRLKELVRRANLAL